MSAPTTSTMNGTSMAVGLISTGVAGVAIFYFAGNLGSPFSTDALILGAEVAAAGVVGGYLASWVNQKFNY